jgi:hypothetical protein
MNFSFDSIDFNLLIKNNDEQKQNTKLIDTTQSNGADDRLKNFDKTTCETYRIKRLFKIDPLTDKEVPDNLSFNFEHEWDPYTGIRGSLDIIGPLSFDAINLYDYYFSNRYKGLWNPPIGDYQGYYGDLVGTGKNIKIKSRGSNPERYLYRIPIIDCYLPQTHNYSHITMGPELSEHEVSQIDRIVFNHHPKKSCGNFASLTMLKYYYDMALESSPDPDCDEIKELEKKYPSLNKKEINEKFNRYWIDKLVRLKY